MQEMLWWRNELICRAHKQSYITLVKGHVERHHSKPDGTNSLCANDWLPNKCVLFFRCCQQFSTSSCLRIVGISGRCPDRC